MYMMGARASMTRDILTTAFKDLNDGKPVLVFDSDKRERETDFVVASQHMTWELIRTMRKDAGGLICTTVPYFFHEKIGLPFLTDLYSSCDNGFPLLGHLVANDIPYDAKSSFALTVNHRKTFTGITDTDRALTIREFAEVVRLSNGKDPEIVRKDFGSRFRTPGHVPLLNTSKEILKTREGHTELATALVIMADLVPSATVCEMMGDDGHALSKEKARMYAERNGLVFLEGKTIIEAWRSRKGANDKNVRG
jgi:3,4-dihydroxy 2-butanone 4-phosphate synthase